MEQDSTPTEGETPEAAPEESPTPTPTGKTFDADYVKQLRSEAAANRKARQEAEAKVQEYEEANKSEFEKLTGQKTKAEQRAAEAEARLLRYEVAAEKQVPQKLVPLLTAASKEELESQADLILENAQATPPPEFDGGARDPAPEPKTPEQAHNDLAVALFGQPRP